MAAIIYTAVDRGTLISSSPAHVQGTQYSIDVKLRAFTEQVDTPKTTHVAIAGNVETVLQRATRVYSIGLVWPNSGNADVEEFLFSIAGGETFSFDPFGTVASADNPVDVVCMDSGFNIGRMSHGSTPWRNVTLRLRPVVASA